MIADRYHSILVGAVLVVTSSSCMAAPESWTLNSACPDTSPHNHWSDYMSAKFPAEPWTDANPRIHNARKLSGVVDVQFRYAKKYKDSKSLPGIDPSACYSISYYPTPPNPGVPTGYRSFAVYDNQDSRLKEGLPGDPAKHEINIDGTLLKFTEKGEVLDLKDRPVGVMVCMHQNNCGQYGY